MAVLGLGNLVVEHDVGTAGRADTKVLLTKLVGLGLESSTGLREVVSIMCKELVLSRKTLGEEVNAPAAQREGPSGASSCEFRPGRSRQGLPRRSGRSS